MALQKLCLEKSLFLRKTLVIETFSTIISHIKNHKKKKFVVILLNLPPKHIEKFYLNKKKTC